MFQKNHSFLLTSTFNIDLPLSNSDKFWEMCLLLCHCTSIMECSYTNVSHNAIGKLMWHHHHVCSLCDTVVPNSSGLTDSSAENLPTTLRRLPWTQDGILIFSCLKNLSWCLTLGSAANDILVNSFFYVESHWWLLRVLFLDIWFPRHGEFQPIVFMMCLSGTFPLPYLL